MCYVQGIKDLLFSSLLGVGPRGGGQISADYERGRFAKVSLDNPGI